MEDYEAPLFVLSGAYFLVFLMAAVQLVILMINATEPFKRETKKTFRILTMIVCAGRCVYNIWFPIIFYESPTSTERFMELCIPRLLSLVYYSTYMLLVVVWAKLFYSMRDPSLEFQSETKAKIEMFYLGANVFLVSIEIIFIAIFFVTDSGSDENKNAFYELLSANSIFLGALMMMWAVGFSWFGVLLYFNMKVVAANTFLRSRQLVLQRLQKVSFITAICTLCFLFRAVITCLFADRKTLEDPNDRFLLAYVIIYLVGEIVPFVLVLTQGSPIRLLSPEEKMPLAEQEEKRPPSTNIYAY